MKIPVNPLNPLDISETIPEENHSFALSSEEYSHACEEIMKLEQKFSDRLEVNHDLTRALVSFQANKSEPLYRWFKYREGFSKPLVEYFLRHSKIQANANILDPFAGTAATCFVSNEHGHRATAIELLPVGSFFIKLRQSINDVPSQQIIKWLQEIVENHLWEHVAEKVPFSHLKITQNAFPEDTESDLAKYRYWTSTFSGTKKIFYDFLSFSILEDISFTRKDGQYLRWDHRSSRNKVRGSFNKGKIYTFKEALLSKCEQIISDLCDISFDFIEISHEKKLKSKTFLYEGSNFVALEKIENQSIDLVITSPPYCNRYDYTRTYALELAYLGCTEDDIRTLRQELLSCTVENRPKALEAIVSTEILSKALKVSQSNKTLQACIAFLEAERKAGTLNNPGIVRMVQGYFTEMSIHIAQLSKVIKPRSRVYMVNDNVRYNGLNIPVDCILSDMAENLGFKCQKIWLLPMGKGNSSQQMKRHGRSELRKCVYIWEKLN